MAQRDNTSRSRSPIRVTPVQHGLAGPAKVLVGGRRFVSHGIDEAFREHALVLAAEIVQGVAQCGFVKRTLRCVADIGRQGLQVEVHQRRMMARGNLLERATHLRAQRLIEGIALTQALCATVGIQGGATRAPSRWLRRRAPARPATLRRA